MKRNESTADRIIRAIIGIALLVFGFIVTGILHWVLLAAGILALFTAITGFCGLYKLLGISTYKEQTPPQK
ncbi:DUF2892 domain-containing protein [candidate division TA06 bacterium]|nr:DUF2892 domain-containing protein [candidate division TA06 bacterium]